MKKIVCATFLVLVTSSFVLADWLEDFKTVYLEKGIMPAVVEVLKQGIAPDAIMEQGLQFEGINPQNLVKAMYCAGIRGDDIKAAGDKYGVSDLIIVAGYKKSVEECGDTVVDTQAYTPVATVVSFGGPTTPGGVTYASPSIP